MRDGSLPAKLVFDFEDDDAARNRVDLIKDTIVVHEVESEWRPQNDIQRACLGRRELDNSLQLASNGLSDGGTTTSAPAATHGGPARVAIVVKSPESLAGALAALTELPETVADLRRDVARLLAAMARVENRLPSPLANVQQAATALGCSVPTIRRKVKAGEIPSMRIGRAVRIDLSKLRALTGAEVRDLSRLARGQ